MNDKKPQPQYHRYAIFITFAYSFGVVMQRFDPDKMPVFLSVGIFFSAILSLMATFITNNDQ